MRAARWGARLVAGLRYSGRDHPGGTAAAGCLECMGGLFPGPPGKPRFAAGARRVDADAAGPWRLGVCARLVAAAAGARAEPVRLSRGQSRVLVAADQGA